MKLSIVLLYVFGPSVVMSSRMIRYLFNATDQCTAQDHITIDLIFNPERRRLLRASPLLERNLKNNKCKDNCAGYVPGMCHAVGCKGDRRSLLGLTDERELEQTCGEQINEINTMLNELIANGRVSESCKEAIKPENRNATCYDDVIYGAVESVKVWNMANPHYPTILQEEMPLEGFSLCRSVLFNIEAKVNPCVDFVNFTLVHAVDASLYRREIVEQDAPYALFGGDTIRLGIGRLPRSGPYNLNIIPDGFLSKQRTINFNVLRC